MNITLRELQERVGGTIDGDAEMSLSGVNALEGAAESDIAFAEGKRYYEQARASRARLIVVPEDFPKLAGKHLLRVANPRVVFLEIVRLFHPDPVYPEGVHPTAVVADGVQLGAGVSIGAHVMLCEGVRIGAGTVIESGVHVGRDAVIGENCWIGPNVILMHRISLGDRVRIHSGSVIGGDGFGYVWAQGRHVKVPHVGTVQIDEDVEIGCNTCVDRATLGVTRIRRGTKIDNLVHVAHNDDIGEDTIIIAQVGLSGSVKVGRRVILAGKVGTSGHITIGDGAMVGGLTVVTKDVKPGEKVWGIPVRPMQQVLRELASLTRLPKFMEQVKEFKARLTRVESRIDKLEGSEK